MPCNVSSVVIPSPAQLSTKKWKEYMAKKPKVISGTCILLWFYVFACIYIYGEFFLYIWDSLFNFNEIKSVIVIFMDTRRFGECKFSCANLEEKQ